MSALLQLSDDRSVICGVIYCARALETAHKTRAHVVSILTVDWLLFTNDRLDDQVSNVVNKRQVLAAPSTEKDNESFFDMTNAHKKVAPVAVLIVPQGIISCCWGSASSDTIDSIN